jgi:predicted nucleotide-binding protein
LSLPKYHIYIEYSEPDKSGIRFNVSHAELVGAFQEPFTHGEPFWFMGRLLNPIKVAKVVIFWSYETADKLRLPNGETLIATKDKKYVVDNILKGKIKGAYLCTEEFVASAAKSPASTPQTQPAAPTPIGTPRRIIVVSGTDETLKQTITGALRKLGLASVVMSEEPSQGKKIIDNYAKDYADVGFAVVLLSPDVYVYPKGEEATKRERTPKQDVTLMFGFLLGKLGKERVLAFYRESSNFAVPEFEGVKFTALDDRDSWKLALIRELTGLGYTVDAERLLR